MIFDGLLARFISTKNQTHHNFLLMAQLIPDQGLQIYQAVSPHSFRKTKMSVIFFTRPDAGALGSWFYYCCIHEVWSVHNMRKSATC